MGTVSTETKILAEKQCYAGIGSLNQIVARSTLQKWLLNDDLFCEEGLRYRRGNHYYSAIVKQQAAERYLSGQISIEQLAKNTSCGQKRRWKSGSSWIYGQKGFRSPEGRRSVLLTMVPYEERKAVVEYCITHAKNYKLIAACFGFTY